MAVVEYDTGLSVEENNEFVEKADRIVELVSIIRNTHPDMKDFTIHVIGGTVRVELSK